MRTRFCPPALLPTVSLIAFSCFLSSTRSEPPPPDEVPAAAQSSEVTPPATSLDSVTIPGPLRSFLRMAAVSQKVSADEVLPLLARHVALEGYEWMGKSRKATNFLILLRRYLQQARELVSLAGPEGVIRVSSCNEAQPLLTILGYRLRQACGPSTSVETADPERAFLTIDSGFPLADLEEMLRGGKTFAHPFPSSHVPVLFSRSDWTALEKDKTGRDEVVSALLLDPALARLYWALSRIDANTRMSLYRSPGLEKLLPRAPVLDFYGSHIYIRSEQVVVPGGARAESAWK